jgi:Electron transfer DM13
MNTPDTPQTSTSRPSLVTRILLALLLAVVLVTGVFVIGRLANTQTVAIVGTTAWFVAVAAVVGLKVRRDRVWWVPCGVAFAVVGMATGAWLTPSLISDTVVDEQVVTADPIAPAPSPGVSSPGASAPPGATVPATPSNVAVATGEFQPLGYEGEGTATIIETPKGTVVTFTGFSTDNGPDLLVRLSSETDAKGRGARTVELGKLKGNRGNQQYTVPDGVDITEFDAVVVWCRAFDVGFTMAKLESLPGPLDY